MLSVFFLCVHVYVPCSGVEALHSLVVVALCTASSIMVTVFSPFDFIAVIDVSSHCVHPCVSGAILVPRLVEGPCLPRKCRPHDVAHPCWVAYDPQGSLFYCSV